MTDDRNADDHRAGAGGSVDRPDEEPAQQLIERARAEGVDLVGPDGLLAGVTKRVIETGL